MEKKIEERNIPSFQLHFKDLEVLKEIDSDYSAIYFMNDKWFGKNQRVWEKERLRRTQFYKAKMAGIDFLALKFPDLFGDRIFFGEFDYSKNIDGRISIIESGFYNVGKPIYEGMFYIQVSDENLQNPYSNSEFFNSKVLESWKEAKSHRAKIVNKEAEELQKVKDERDFLKRELEEKNRKEKEEVSQKETKREESKQEEIKREIDVNIEDINEEKGILIWDGLAPQELGVKVDKAFQKFQNNIEQNEIKAELNHVLGSYLGKQDLEMIYDYVSNEFRISFKNKVFSGDFKVEVPEELVDEFHSKVTGFKFHFKKEMRQVQTGTKRVQIGKKKVPNGYEIIKAGRKKVPNGVEIVKTGEKQIQDGFEKVSVGTKQVLVGYTSFEKKPQYKTVEVFEKKPKYKTVNTFTEKQKFKIVDILKKKPKFKEVDVFEEQPVFNDIERLLISNISTKFKGKEYFAKGFDPEAFVKVEEKRERELELITHSVRCEMIMFHNATFIQKLNWESACKYCEELKALGFSDWRLPEKTELRKAFKNFSRFTEIKKDWYWSNTKYNKTNSWIVNFDTGTAGWNLINREGYVFCARNI
jgi:hypothetical protein